MTTPSPLPLAAVLATLAGCAGPLALAPGPASPLTRTSSAEVASRLAAALEQDHGLAGAAVRVTRSMPADLDHDGDLDDLAGSALLRQGRRFKSVIFLLRDGAEARLLEADGSPFQPAEPGVVLTCWSKPVACPDTFERAVEQLPPARFALVDLGPERDGPGLAIALEDGSHGLLDPTKLFRVD